MEFELTTVIVNDNQGNIHAMYMPSNKTIPVLEAWNEFYDLGLSSEELIENLSTIMKEHAELSSGERNEFERFMREGDRIED